jgi:hydroxyacylglutathione hydrolase
MVMEIFAHRVVGPLACNCYIVGDPNTRDAVVIDPGGEADELARLLTEQKVNVVYIVATHAHFDHLVAAEELRKLTGAPFLLHGQDRPVLDWYRESGRLFLGIELPPPPEIDGTLVEGDKVGAGRTAFEVLHTPGHSPGSISLVGEGTLFSGDTLFASSIGRSDLPGGDDQLLRRMIRGKLFGFDDETIVFPGHGPATTIGQERALNPFVGDGSRRGHPGP